MDETNKQQEIKSFVLRKGRITPGQQKAYDALADKFVLKDYSDIKGSFPSQQPLILEIGFGMGDASWQIAQENPEKNYLGIEVYKPGVAKLLKKIGEHNLTNVRIIQFDAVQILKNFINDNYFSGIHIFFPDPWQKKKHHKRRLIKSEFITFIADKMEKKAYLYVVTDWDDYAIQILEVLSKSEKIKNKYKDFADSQDWRPSTNFEYKGLKKEHEIYEFLFYKQ